MNQQQTLELLRRCEQEHAKALATTKTEQPEDELEATARAAAAAIWNGWAEQMLAKRKALEASGEWSVERNEDNGLVPKNDATSAWIKEASTEFSDLHFRSKTSQVALPTVKSELLVLSSGDIFRFDGFVFPSDVDFQKVRFEADASFKNTEFLGDVNFFKARFFGECIFSNAIFTGYTSFDSADFQDDAFFSEAEFKGMASFYLATFHRFAGFLQAKFSKGSDFRAIRGERAFTLAGSTFEKVPNFVQAYFAAPPLLNNMIIKNFVIAPHTEVSSTPDEHHSAFRKLKRSLRGSWTFPRRAISGCWRRIRYPDYENPDCFAALRRIAIQGNDDELEWYLFTRELRSARFIHEWPLPWPFWRYYGWAGSTRFWIGFAYQIFGGFGGSLSLPAFWWLVTLFISAIFFLGQNEDVAAARAALQMQGSSTFSAYVQTSYLAWRDGRGCYSPLPPENSATTYIGGLSPGIRAKTDAVNEAFQLALRNAFILLDNGGDAAHRSYGCLYGVELYGGSNPIAIVPGAVSFASAVQKIFSALFIFLFGLALRNIVKLK